MLSSLFYSLILLWRNNVINLKNHLYYLSCKLKLVLLRKHGFENSLLIHVCRALKVGVYSNEGICFSDLLFSKFGYILYRIKTRILS